MKSRASLIRIKTFQVDEKRRQLAQIDGMIAEFTRMADELDEQIELEQKRTGISDLAHYAYPTFARAAMTRRDNLRNSATELQGQRDAAQDALAEAIEELKKIELMEERDQIREREAQDLAEQDALDEVARHQRSAVH
jgi:flagellar export protein FliJ